MRTWLRQNRLCALAALPFLLCLSAPAAGGEAQRVAPPGLAGFRLELLPQFDDVFPAATEYQRTLDRASLLGAAMRRVSDDFARVVQDALREVNALSPSPVPSPKRCPAQVAASYARAQILGQEYLRTGRELVRHHELVRELDRLGDSAGLTPDYRGRVQKVLRSYEALLSDYREMKATFHDQLTFELRFAGCEIGPKAGVALASTKEAPLREEKPQPQAAASAAKEARGNILFYVDNSRCRRGHAVILDGQHLGAVDGEARAGFRATAGPHELCLLSQPDPPGTRVATIGAAPPTSPAAVTAPTSGEGAPRDAGAQAEGEATTQLATEPASPPVRCGESGMVRRSYLHEGWTIALRCE